MSQVYKYVCHADSANMMAVMSTTNSLWAPDSNLPLQVCPLEAQSTLTKNGMSFSKCAHSSKGTLQGRAATSFVADREIPRGLSLFLVGATTERTTAQPQYTLWLVHLLALRDGLPLNGAMAAGSCRACWDPVLLPPAACTRPSQLARLHLPGWPVPSLRPLPTRRSGAHPQPAPRRQRSLPCDTRLFSR